MSKTDTEMGVSEQQIKEIKEAAKNRIKAVKASAKEEIHRIQMECYAALKPAKAAKKVGKAQQRAERKAYEATIPKRYSIGEEIFNSITHGIGGSSSAIGPYWRKGVLRYQLCHLWCISGNPVSHVHLVSRPHSLWCKKGFCHL